MTVKECYEQINGDYEGVFGRFRGDERIKKFAVKFLADGSFDSLCKTLEAADYSEAFRAAHTLKGVSQNLGFTALMSSSSRLTEALRSGVTPEAPALAKEVAADYERTAAALKELQASVG